MNLSIWLTHRKKIYCRLLKIEFDKSIYEKILFASVQIGKKKIYNDCQYVLVGQGYVKEFEENSALVVIVNMA